MIVVIQCAASKRHHAGRLFTDTGLPVEFVGDPAKAPQTSACLFARPDDLSASGKTWRDGLSLYNAHPTENPLGLLPAFRLYENPVYERLVEKFGLSNVYILSAGWGLLSAGFLTPHYDITFRQSAEDYKRRRKRDVYQDFCMLPLDADTETIFLGGKDYVPLFTTLSAGIRGRRTIFYNSASPPDARGCELKRFPTSTRTNWHNECAAALLAGTL